jgi:uridine phosphorylase
MGGAGDAPDSGAGLDEAGIVPPPPPFSAAAVAPLTLMVAASGDCRRLRARLQVPPEAGQALYLSRFVACDAGFNLVGPLLGAPMAAMLLETLAAWGSRRVVFWGWCGALAPGITSGDVITPCGAFIDEGTSRHYGAAASQVGHPSPALQTIVNGHLMRQGLTCRDGWIWTTDAVFRETPRKLAYFQRQGALAVEMELSAVFTLARALTLEVAAVLIVSDELTTGQWRPGFKSQRFRQARHLVGEALHCCVTAAASTPRAT